MKLAILRLEGLPNELQSRLLGFLRQSWNVEVGLEADLELRRFDPAIASVAFEALATTLTAIGLYFQLRDRRNAFGPSAAAAEAVRLAETVTERRLSENQRLEVAAALSESPRDSPRGVLPRVLQLRENRLDYRL